MSQLILILVTVVGALVALALAGLVLVLRHRERVTARIQALFRRPPKPAKPPGPGHYYKPYWS
jgi:hypothetical protein